MFGMVYHKHNRNSVTKNPPAIYFIHTYICMFYIVNSIVYPICEDLRRPNTLIK